MVPHSLNKFSRILRNFNWFQGKISAVEAGWTAESDKGRSITLQVPFKLGSVWYSKARRNIPVDTLVSRCWTGVWQFYYGEVSDAMGSFRPKALSTAANSWLLSKGLESVAIAPKRCATLR